MIALRVVSAKHRVLRYGTFVVKHKESRMALINIHCTAVLLCPAHREGAVSVAFVRPSVRLSPVRPSRAWRIIRESKGLACPNLEVRFLTLDANRVPISRLRGQR